MKKYNIAIVAPVPFYYHVPFYQRLAQSAEIDCTVYYCSRETLDGTDVKKTYNTAGAFVAKDYLLEGYRSVFMKNYALDPSYLNWPFGLVNFGIVGAIVKNNYDAVVLQSWTNLTWWMAFVTCLITRTPVFFMTDSNIFAERTKPNFKKTIKHLLLGNFLFRFAAGFLTSGTANEDFYHHYGVPSSKMVRTKFSWGYKDLLDQAERIKPERETIRSSLGIASDDFVVLYVGRLASEKAPLTLVKAYEAVRAPNKKLLIVGDGPLRQDVEEYVKNHNIPGVTMSGFQPRSSIGKFYAAADVLVIPSYQETWGIVVNEAMCFGLPVIASEAVGAAIDLIGEGINGFTVPSGDCQQFCNRIEMLASMPFAERSRMGERSKEVITEWTYDIHSFSQLLTMLNHVTRK